MTSILTPRIYTSRDVDAPVVTAGDITSILTMLQAVLVDGYGSGPDLKESLGWESDYNPTGDRAVFRPTDVGSNRHWLYVDAKSHPWGNHYNYMNGYQLFHGWTGDDINAEGIFGASNTARAYTAALGDRDWMIIGTSRSFYMWISHFRNGIAGDFGPSLFNWDESGTHGWQAGSDFFFGDLGPKSTGYNTEFCGQTGTSNSASYNMRNGYRGSAFLARMNAALTGWKIAADPTGLSANITMAHMLSMAINGGGGAGQAIGGHNMAEWPPVDGNLSMERIKVRANPYLYGHLPGLWAPYHELAVRNAERPFNYLDVIQSGGVDYKIVVCGGNNAHSGTEPATSLLIETNVPWYEA